MVKWYSILKEDDWPMCDKCTRPARYKNKDTDEKLCGVHFAFDPATKNKVRWESMTEGM